MKKALLLASAMYANTALADGLGQYLDNDNIQYPQTPHMVVQTKAPGFQWVYDPQLGSCVDFVHPDKVLRRRLAVYRLDKIPFALPEETSQVAPKSDSWLGSMTLDDILRLFKE